MAQKLREMWQWVAYSQPQVADFRCPITNQIMKDPVVAEDKFNYERNAITAWLKNNTTSPQTGNPMGSKLKPNTQLNRAIEEFEKKCLEGPESESQISWPAHGLRASSETRSVTIGSTTAVPNAAADDAEEPPSKRRRSERSEKANMSEAMSKAFRELDEVRDLLFSVLDGWTPPKIMVIGDESAGKSTILEQLAMIPVFPRERRFCTRLAIELRLRRSPAIKATLSVYHVTAEGRNRCGSPMEVPQENGWIWVQKKMLSLVAKLSTELAGIGIVKDKIIVLEVSCPDAPSIDLVDLPGLTTVPVEKVNEIQAVLQRQLEEDRRTGGHSMYLAIVPASGDVRPNTNKAMEFVQSNDLKDKTIGVFSKCDQVSDPDVLHSLVTGKDTEDGYQPAQLGAVHLDKGWVATMLKPPSGKEFQVHNFERILIQQKQDLEFFQNNAYYKDIAVSGQAGMVALVERLEREYSNYLNTTWKDGAMKKVLEKLEAKKFELSMLGVVEDQATKNQLARKELERRLGPNSPVEDLYTRFMKEVLKDHVCRHAMSAGVLGALNGVTWEGHDIRHELDKLRQNIKSVAKGAVDRIEDFWMPKLESILVAESTVDAAEGDIVTDCGLGIRLRLWGKGKAQRRMRKDVQQAPLIQLSNYKGFTDAIVSKCRSLFKAAAKDLLDEECGAGTVNELLDRFVEPDSKWLRLKPELASQDGAVSSKVRVECDTRDFLDVLVTLFLRAVPSPRDLQAVHENIEVGVEEGRAKERFEELRQEIKKVEAARDGIRKALSINDEEFEQMKATFDEEPAPVAQ